MNSNTFSDQKDQAHSYKFGSLTHSEAATRAQAVAHNIEVHRDRRSSSAARRMTVWIGDGSQFPRAATLPSRL